MTLFPLALNTLLGKFGAYIVYLLIGFAFGYVLEIAGFGNSPKLANQFYFKDQTVLKVMFTGIVVAMVLIFGAAAVGLLDYNLIWVNPTYLWPGIVGGLIMGFGFILGGFCPGTSLVAMATLKLDGLFFALGTLFGIFLFGETVSSFEIFWNSSYMGRFTLSDWLGLDIGTVVLIIVFMALFMFWGAEKLEQHFGNKDPKDAPKWRYGGAGVLVLAAVGVLAIGQPNTLDRWNRLASEKEPLLTERAVQLHPGEVAELLHDHKLNLKLLDVRSENDFNLFHIANAENILLDEIPGKIPEFHLEPANTVFIIMSNDETAATEVWKVLVAESVPNVYILEGGINNWIEIFAANETASIQKIAGAVGDDQIRYQFAAALGAMYKFSYPNVHDYVLNFTPKMKLELKKGPTSGGCG